MNKAKKYYVDKDNNMIGYTKYYRTEKIEKLAEPFHAKLKIIVNVFPLYSSSKQFRFLLLAVL